MTHEFTLVAPPLWMRDRPNTLYIIWSVVGVAQWWEMARRARYANAPDSWLAWPRPRGRWRSSGAW
jgi:hypothetical protein